MTRIEREKAKYQGRREVFMRVKEIFRSMAFFVDQNVISDCSKLLEYFRDEINGEEALNDARLVELKKIKE